MPTLLEAAGVAPPGDRFEGRSIHPITGTSMLPVLTGEASQVHPESETVGYELAGSSAVFKGSHKLVRNLPPKGTGSWELYDLVADPSEMHDLAGKMPVLVAELEAAYIAYVKANNVIEVPDDYDPLKQVIKNRHSWTLTDQGISSASMMAAPGTQLPVAVASPRARSDRQRQLHQSNRLLSCGGNKTFLPTGGLLPLWVDYGLLPYPNMVLFRE